MSVPAPHFLLYAEAALAADGDDCTRERWRFILRTPAGETAAEAADEEPAAGRERLELLAVIRGLEALDQPSRVTLMSGSRSLQCGLELSLSQWRENNWHWERYGRLTPIKNADLWQRLDRLTSIHRVHCPQSRTRTSDDLAPPISRKTTSGRNLRIDQPRPRRGKHENRNLKHETASKREVQKVPHASRWGLSRLLVTNLYRTACWVLGAFSSCRLAKSVRLRIATLPNTDRPSTTKPRGVSRAHDRLPRRHERSTRRPVGAPAGSAGAADDPA